MKDEFTFLRVIIATAAAVLVLGLFVHACREASEQRARAQNSVNEAIRIAHSTCAGSTTLSACSQKGRVCPERGKALLTLDAAELTRP